MTSRLLRALLFVIASGASLAAFAKSPAASLPTGKLSSDAIPRHYDLHLSVDPRSDRFSGEARIEVELAKATDRVWLHAQAIDIASAAVIDAKGVRTTAKAIVHGDSGVLELQLGHRLPAQAVTLALTWSAPFNAQLEGVYKVTVGADSYAITQMEPVSARFAFPGFDEPRFKTPFDIRLTVPRDEVALANTRQLHEEVSSDGRSKTLAFATTKPLPTYLVAFAVGPWDVVDASPIPANDVRKNALPLRGVGPRGSAKQLAWILGQTPAIVKFYEDYTAQPYPFDKLDLLGAPDFSAGAMENAGLIVFRDALLLLDAHASAERYRSVFNVTAHEIAHQWYGDLVTVPWWNDIWLNEAYATWAQAKATTALQPAYHAPMAALESRLHVMANDSLLSARKVRQSIGGRGDIETAFDGITYQKGAGVLAMFEAWIGADVFRDGMRRYLARHAFGSGSSDDLIAALAAASGKDAVFAKAMRSFLDQPGVPLVHASVACEDARATLTLRQSRYLPYGVLAKDQPLWGIPVCARFGHGKTSATQCFMLDVPEQRFAVAGMCPDWVLPNADARGYYRFELAPDDFTRLAQALPALSAPEQLVYADALSSAFRRGAIGASALLDAMPALARSDLPQVATALLDDFHWIDEQLADAPTQHVLNAYVHGLYAPRLAELGYRRRHGEPSTAAALRTRLADFLAIVQRVAPVRAELAAQGRAALGLGREKGVDFSRADADLLPVSLKVAVQDGGTAAFDAALGELARNHDTAQRYLLLSALGSTRDLTLAERARDYGLRPTVQIGEMSRLYAAQAEQPENRAALWQWFKLHYDVYRARVPAFAQGYLPKTFAEGRCSSAAADELAAFFAPRIKDLIGGERGLGQTLEGIRQCASLREHARRASLAGWVEARR